jgi:hypothetical protein
MMKMMLGRWGGILFLRARWFKGVDGREIQEADQLFLKQGGKSSRVNHVMRLHVGLGYDLFVAWNGGMVRFSSWTDAGGSR